MEAATAANAPIARRTRFRRTVSDEVLVDRVRDGDELAFEVIYDRYHGDLLAFCRHMLGSREEAEDALQHVFVAAHRNLGDPERDILLRPWLYAVARNRCLSVLRARRESVCLDDLPEPASAGLAVAAEVEHRQDLKDMLADIARLPDDQRAALLLAELGALSHDEIAEALDVRRDKVKALVFQARESLMGWREAREADCKEIREQLATLRGGALRRAPLRRHLETCAECREFQQEVRRQRAALAIVLPVVPSAALKHNVLTAAFATGKAGAVAGGVAASGVVAGAGGIAVLGGTNGGGLAALGSGLLGKGLAIAAVAGGLGGGYVAVHGGSDHATSPSAPTAAGARPDRSATHDATPLASRPKAHHGGPVTPGHRGPARHQGASRPSHSSPAKGTGPMGSFPPASGSPSTPTGFAPTAVIAPTPAPSENTAATAPATKERKGRGPVQHEPGVPVRRGPVEDSNGQGPPPAGTDRGKNDDATAGSGKSEDAPGKIKQG
jgi:RNA polymerase sigma factor (sigma-70 family)